MAMNPPWTSTNWPQRTYGRPRLKTEVGEPDDRPPFSTTASRVLSYGYAVCSFEEASMNEMQENLAKVVIATVNSRAMFSKEGFPAVLMRTIAEALQEPTPTMIAAGTAVLDQGAEAVWSAMLDATTIGR
jgi:hypothetical protein